MNKQTARLKYIQARESEATYKCWEHLVGVENAEGKELTERQLRAWASRDDRELECVFCGYVLPLSAQYCPRCREYKGIGPKIAGWSEW